ncbi:hypothetical protein [Cellulomonas sp. PhB143]|uniref:hypothetical protein n=1 Tax=Cellulomonas sp. PhB143 TaxID=2485186 RepID=UPI000F49FE97|nr:hypothetical protein [Cellulomonas sp. PhB143]ROS79012.1 hypothetical protein EDF32_0195 [Cellulomonas sp. PhB143]
MEILFDALLVLHFVGWAIVLGAYLTSLRGPGLPVGVFHGAATALVAGTLAYGLSEASDFLGYDLDPAKFGTKIVVALVITVLAFVAQRKGEALSPALKHTIGALTVVNIVIACFWH